MLKDSSRSGKKISEETGLRHFAMHVCLSVRNACAQLRQAEKKRMVEKQYVPIPPEEQKKHTKAAPLPIFLQYRDHGQRNMKESPLKQYTKNKGETKEAKIHIDGSFDPNETPASTEKSTLTRLCTTFSSATLFFYARPKAVAPKNPINFALSTLSPSTRGLSAEIRRNRLVFH